MDSIISDNIPVLTEQEKFNETAISSVQRLAAKLRGQPVPAAPQRADNSRQRTYKTKARPSNARICLVLASGLHVSSGCERREYEQGFSSVTRRCDG